MTALSSMESGKKVRIVKIDAERLLRAQLLHLGLREGDVLKVLQNNRGDLIVAKGHLRLALGRALAQKVGVEKKEGENRCGD